MNWGMFWITVAVVVGILIILSQIASVRAWASRVFSRVLPAFGQTSPNKPIGALIGAFGAQLAGLPWLRLAAIPLVIGAIFGIVTYIEHRGADREKIKRERENVIVAEHERDVSDLAAKLGIETEQDARRVDRVIAQAEQEIEDAVEADDFDRLYRAYELGVCGVLSYPECADSSDPAPRRAAPVLGPRAHSA